MKLRWLLFPVGLVVAIPIAYGVALLVPASLPAGTPTPVTVTVPNGATATSVATSLHSAHVLGSTFLFRVAMKLSGNPVLLAGDYAFPKGQSAFGLVRALRSGRYRSNEVTVTIPEGFTQFQIAARLAVAGVIGGTTEPGTKCAGGVGTRSDLTKCVSQSDFFPLVETPNSEIRALVPGLPADASLEGYLFPDTYRFLKHTASDAVVRRFLDNFAAKRAKLPSPAGSAVGHSFHEVVILASIVEREVKTATDRAMVADLFWRRLAAGIPLQSDATVNYATGKSALQPTLEDTQTDSAYNTYRHAGLPPGPIGNPGLESLTATLKPTSNEYLYFLTKPDGTTVFSKTLDEHNANKAKYLK